MNVKHLKALGFDLSYSRGKILFPRCSQCQFIAVNGTPTHEIGCPNAVQECRGCNELLPMNNEIERLKSELADCRQCFDATASKLEASRTELSNTRTEWLNDHVSLTAKLDASTKAYALLASHRDRLADSLAAIVEIPRHFDVCPQIAMEMYDKARKALGGNNE